MQIPVVELSEKWTVFPRSNTVIVDSSPARGMEVCECVYSVFVQPLVYLTALPPADPPSLESYRLCIGLRKCKAVKAQQKGYKTANKQNPWL
jgi:hypothetical protein